MELEYILLKYDDVKMDRRDTPKLRGYFANKYNEYIELHNHKDDKFVYKYPIVQYKVIDNIPILLGLKKEGIDIVKEVFFTNNQLRIDTKEYDIYEKNINMYKREYGSTEDVYKYEFLTPWIGLNQKNNKEYRQANIIDKELILNRVLVGNILSCSKYLGYTVEEEIKVKSNLKKMIVQFKGVKMIGFTGMFYTNFMIPDYLGIGKSVARGFGTIKRIS
ncbi:CRISPR-associated endonuclease Cas6 [Vallitalea sediminicola]